MVLNEERISLPVSIRVYKTFLMQPRQGCLSKVSSTKATMGLPLLVTRLNFTAIFEHTSSSYNISWLMGKVASLTPLTSPIWLKTIALKQCIQRIVVRAKIPHKCLRRLQKGGFLHGAHHRTSATKPCTHGRRGACV